MLKIISIIFLIVSQILCEPDPADSRKNRGGISSSPQNAIPGPITEYNGKAGDSLPQLPQGLEQYDINRVPHSQIYSHISGGVPPPGAHQPQGFIYNVQSQATPQQTPLMIQYAPLPLQHSQQGPGQQFQLIQLVPTTRAMPHMVLQLQHGNSVLLGHGGNPAGLYSNQVPQIVGLGIGYQPQGRIQLVLSPHSQHLLNNGVQQDHQNLNTNEFIPSQPSAVKQ